MNELLKKAHERSDHYLHEYECYQLFATYGINTPAHEYFPLETVSKIPNYMKESQKYVLKCQIAGILHKSDIGGVITNVTKQTAQKDIDNFVAKLQKHGAVQGILVVEQKHFCTSTPGGGELLVSALIDRQFGPLVCFGQGGTAVEFMRKTQPDSVLFIPCSVNLESDKKWSDSLREMPITQYLTGKVRGHAKVLEFERIVEMISAIQRIINNLISNSENYYVEELEINPCVVDASGQIVALDGVVKIAQDNLDKRIRTLQFQQSLKPLYKANLFFAPRTVLLAGVSTKVPSNPCNQVLNQLQKYRERYNTDFKIVLLHPNEQQISGIPCFKTLAEVQQTTPQIDLFVCGVSAVQAGGLLTQAAQGDLVQTAFVLTAGIGETEQGKQLQNDLQNILVDKQSQCRYVDDEFVPNKDYSLFNGPNTLGYKVNELISTIFVDPRKSSACDLKNEIIQTPYSNVALLCQSGAFMISRLSDLAHKVSPVFSMSVGNQMGMSNVDFLEWLLQTDSANQLKQKAGIISETIAKVDAIKQQLQVYALYVEGMNLYDGSRLLKLIDQIRKMNKIIVIYKTGRTEQGAHAAAGHTASITGSYETFKQLVSTQGAIICDSLQEFEDTVYLAASSTHLVKQLKLSPHVRVGVVTNAGFEKCCFADHLFLNKKANRYIKLPNYEADKEMHEQLLAVFAKYKLSAVVDLDLIIDTTPTIPDLGYFELCEVLFKSNNIDCIVMSAVPETHMMNTCSGDVSRELQIKDFAVDPGSFVNLMIKLAEQFKNKLFILNIESGWKYNECREAFAAKGIPVFTHADRCSRALSNLIIGLYD